MTLQTADYTPYVTSDAVEPTHDDLISRARDYEVIRAAIQFLTENWTNQPDLTLLAEHVGLSQAHCQKLFKRWCGLSPKAFVQAITIDHARSMLNGSSSLLNTAHDVGLSGPSRLHDLFVDHEAMTPGDYKRRGAGLTVSYGFHPCPFGTALAMATDRGLCGLAFLDDTQDDDRATALNDMTRRWPAAAFKQAPGVTGPYLAQIFADPGTGDPQPIRLVLIGTNFEVRVWETLLQIPMGKAVTYNDVATTIGQPTAARAVGSAVGRNPISFVVPCHRVRRKDGGLGGYHWGLTRKQALIGWEYGRTQGA